MSKNSAINNNTTTNNNITCIKITKPPHDEHNKNVIRAPMRVYKIIRRMIVMKIMRHKTEETPENETTKKNDQTHYNDTQNNHLHTNSKTHNKTKQKKTCNTTETLKNN